jgi:predicted metal-dependent peptidase
MSDKPGLNFQAARLKAIAKAPYLATAIWAMHPIATPGIGTMGIDKFWRLYYDPEVVEEWDVDGTATVLIHEVWHLLRRHPERAEEMGIDYDDRGFETQYKHKVWNLAADCELNDDIRQEGHTFPIEGVFPETFDLPEDKIAEWYFDKIFDENEMQNAKKALQKLIQKIKDAIGEDGNPMAGDDGSGAGGIAKDWEKGKDATDEDGEPLPQTLEGEGELVRQQVAHDIKKNIGNAPGHAERWAEERLNPKVDWRRQLQGAIRGALMQAAGRVDYSYTRPSRRQSAVPQVVLPVMRGPKPSVAMVIDTSGSMSQKDLARALGEAKGVVEATESKVSVIACDARAYEIQDIYRAEDIDLTGGGGTDMNAGLDKAEEIKPAPAIAIVFTDGYTPPWREKKPDKIDKVVICLIEQGNRSWGSMTETPSWATVIKVDSE